VVVNWFSSYVFRADWFASRWWTHVTVPVTTTVNVGSGGGRSIDWGIPIYETQMPNLFDAQEDKSDLSLQEIEFHVPDFFENWNPRPKPQPVRREPVMPKRKRVRHLDAKASASIRKVSSGGECSVCKFPTRLRDIYGDMEVLSVYCVTRESGRTIRHLG
jgi:hypothetical protein